MSKAVRLCILALVLLTVANLAIAEEMRTLAKQGGQGTALFAAQDVQPLDIALTPLFEAAAEQYNVPVELLETLAYFGSGFENRGSIPNVDGGYGIMALRDNILTGESLNEAAIATKASRSSLITDPAASINGAAAVLNTYATAAGIDKAAGIEAWLQPVIRYAGFDAENSKFFAYEVFDLLQAGLDFVNGEGEQFKFAPQSIGSIDLDSLRPKSVKKAKSGEMGAFSSDVSAMSSDYGPATWDPAASCNYSTATHGSDTVVIHTMEGSLAGTTSWFKNCAAQGSSHYGIGTNGAVVQYVLESQTAWHAGCYNYRSIGLEHEGYASQSSHPQALYDASAALTREICNERGIPKSHTSCGPGICGHLDVNNCACGPGHTDPGNGWDWNYFISKVNGGGSGKPHPCVGNNADGRIEVFARGRNGAIYHAAIRTTGGWSDWASLGGTFKGDPVVANNADGRMEVFCVASDGRLLHAYQTSANGGWYSWGDLGGNWPGNVTVARNSDGRLEVFLRGSTNRIYHKYQTAANGAWSANWEYLGTSVCKNDPVAITDKNGYIHVFAVGTGGSMLEAKQSASGWSDFSGIGGNWNRTPVAARNADGRLEVFCIGTDGQMNHKWQNADGTWAANWDYSLAGNWTHDPVVFPDQNGALQVFCVGTTGTLYTKYQTAPNGGWSTSWTSLGGTWGGDPGVGMNADGRDEIFMVGNDPYMYHSWESAPNGPYGGWSTLGPNNIF